MKKTIWGLLAMVLSLVFGTMLGIYIYLTRKMWFQARAGSGAQIPVA